MSIELSDMIVKLKLDQSGFTKPANDAKKTVGGLSGAFNNLKSEVPQIGEVFSLISNPISLAAGAIGAFAAVSQKAITQTVDYNKLIRESTQLTGLSAEETSRLVQVGDDWGLSMETTTKAMEMMNKKGITPSTENLAKIADEYVNATDKSKFMEAATKKYGKAFADLIPILAKGGDALREQTGAVDENMIATDKSIASSREYEEAMDKLGDTFQGILYILGEGLLPIITDVLNIVNQLTDSMKESSNAAETLRRAHEEGLLTDREYAIAIRDLRNNNDNYKTVVEKVTTAEKNMQDQEDKLNSARASTITSTGELADETDRATLSLIDFTKAAMGAKIIEALNQAFLDGTISQEEYIRQMVEAEDHMMGMSDKAIIASIEMNKLEKQLKDGTITTEQFADRVYTLNTRIDNLDGTEASTYINEYHTTYYEEIYGPGGSNRGPGQSGGHHAAGAAFTVPTGYYENFPLGYASSGEGVLIIPAEKNRQNVGTQKQETQQIFELDYDKLAYILSKALRVELQKI